MSHLPSWQLRWSLFGFLMGLYISQYLNLYVGSLLFLITSIVVFSHFRYWHLAFFCFSFGCLYPVLYEFYFSSPDLLKKYRFETVNLSVQIIRQPDRKLTQQYLQTRVLNIETQPKILIITKLDPYYAIGDQLEIEGKIRPIRNFSDDFDLQKYWSRFDIFYEIKNPKIRVKQKNTSLLQKLRKSFSQNIKNNLPTPHQQIAQGVLIGLKEALPKPIAHDFKSSGLQHLLVVSGTNITLLLACLIIFFKPLGPRLVLILSIFCTLLYVNLVGFDPPVLRAAIFGSLTGVSLALGRFCDARNLILFAAIVLSLWDPKMLLQDVSFWLSFSATLGIILGMPLFWHYTSFLKNHNYLRLLLGVSFCAQIAVFPVLIYTFGSFPFSGFLSNLLAEPLVPFLMLSNTIIGLLGSAPPFISEIISIPSFLGIEILLMIAHIFSLFGHFEISKFWSLITGFMLFMLTFWSLFSYTYQKKYLQPFEAELDF